MPISSFISNFVMLPLVVLTLVLAACTEPPPPPVETVRAIRTITVSEPASGKMRRFSGVVDAADTSNISFSCQGTCRPLTRRLVIGSRRGSYPIGALSPGGGDDGNFVFVYDADTSTLKRTAIEDDGIRDSGIVVTSGLSAGDVVAVAGVSFLRDGQKVRLLER